MRPQGNVFLTPPRSSRFGIVILSVTALAAVFAIFEQTPISSGAPSGAATYSRGLLHVSIPYHAPHAGPGQLTMEVLDPEDRVVGRAAQGVQVAEGAGQLQSEIRLTTSMPLEDLVWHRVHYRLEYQTGKNDAWEGTESISQIIRTPVIHIIGQQSYLAGARAAVRVIVTDSSNEAIPGRGAVRIELQGSGHTQVLYTGSTNRHGTTEAQFRLPAGLVGGYELHYVVDTTIGSTEFTQPVRLEDKAAILLTTEKPIYQPGQVIHARALALDRSDHHASANHKLTFEVEDSRGNKVFKKATATDEFGVASAEFGLADEVNLGTYHLRALIGPTDAPANTAELAFNVERYVLPKFKVAVELCVNGAKPKHGYRPGDHVTGTVRANYFFGKPVDGGEVALKASAMDVQIVQVASATGKMDRDGSYQFDMTLPRYFAGRPLSHGAARVLIEATVKDSAGHAETRGEPITVSEAPLLITAIPEGGTLAPNLENEVFILTAYPDGTPAQCELKVRAEGMPAQHTTTDDAGVGEIRVRPGRETEALLMEARDKDGNSASATSDLQTRTGEDQILLRGDRAVYRAGEAIHLSVFSTKASGAAYVDVVKEGQTVLTRDVDFQNGRAELTLAATPEMAGTVDLNAYLFGRDARPVGDHRLVFIQPAEELKVEAATDYAVYRPGAEARIQFHVTDGRGAGVHAALGLQVVDEAVFALAEKQPGFAKVFFYLEQEVMKPRYEIHSIGMPGIIESRDGVQPGQHDRAARALFSATEVVNSNKFDGRFGGDVPTTKLAEYLGRYQARFMEQVQQLAKDLSLAYERNRRQDDLTRILTQLESAGSRSTRDAWGTELRLQPVESFDNGENKYYRVNSAGPDQQFDTPDDLMAFVELRTGNFVQPHNSGGIEFSIEHDRGPWNGLADIVGTVIDPSGAAVANADVQVRQAFTGKTRSAKANWAGRFTVTDLPPGEYSVQVSSPGFVTSKGDFHLLARDRAVLSTTLGLGSATEAVEVTLAPPMPVPPPMEAMGVAGGVPGGVMEGSIGALKQGWGAGMGHGVGPGTGGGIGGGVFSVGGGVRASAAPAARVRSYFPEALYINPEIITDKNGRASVTVPIADSITTWRMAMIASTEHGALGTSASSLKVFQDFFVDLDLPVTLTQGDRVSIPVGIYNYSGARGQVDLKLQPEDWYALADDTGEKSVEVDSGCVGGAQFTVQAQRIGKFKLTLAAKMDGQQPRADIVVREIEVIPNGREQSQVFNGRLENTVQHQVSFPADAIPDASKIYVRLYPGPMSQVVEGMDSLLRMPYGCFEQTSSSTYPNVLALDYMKRTNKLTPEVHAKAEGYIVNGYQRLLTFEVPGGGFSWFGSAPANKILTAYGLMEFYDMSKVYDVDARLVARTQQWLASQQRADGSWRPDTSFINEGATNRFNSDVLRITAYLGWSLENTGYRGPAVERARQFVENGMGARMDAYTLAVIANFAADNGTNSDFSHRAIQLLLDARTEKDDKVWWNAEETSVYARGTSAAVETTGLAVQALLKSGQATGTARKALNYLTSQKGADGTWGTTQSTIMALRALLLATDKGSADTQGELSILLDGSPAGKLTLTPENNDLLHQFVFKVNVGAGSAGPEPNAVRPDDSNTTPPVDSHTIRPRPGTIRRVELRFEGKGALAYQVVGSYFLPWKQQAAREALSIDVAYDRTRLAQDDIAIATATIRNNLDQSADMVMVDLGIPPGFDLLSEDLQDYQDKSASFTSGRLEKFSLTATQAILYFDSFAAGSTTGIKFRLRAKYPIRAKTFQSRVYEYYDPEVSSVAQPVQLVVSKR